MIYRVYAGSRLYGTAREDSDYDERGVCLMPRSSLLGLGAFEQINRKPDTVIYGINKFFKLALECNPNILEILFAPADKWLESTWQWEEIYKNRHKFLHGDVRKRFSGYAFSQLKKMKLHKRWLELAPVEGADEWKNYQTWIRNRNPARAELEKKYGYDTKHAANLIRMLRQGINLLNFGTFSPVLSVVTRLVVSDVMEGRYAYEDLLDYAANLDKEIKDIPTPLPDKPARDELEQLLISINLDSLKGD